MYSALCVNSGLRRLEPESAGVFLFFIYLTKRVECVFIVNGSIHGPMLFLCHSMAKQINRLQDNEPLNYCQNGKGDYW